jgi:hypothetical protein
MEDGRFGHPGRKARSGVAGILWQPRRQHLLDARADSHQSTAIHANLEDGGRKPAIDMTGLTAARYG